MITEDYVSFETAKLLKEKGFDEEVTSFYLPNGTLSHGNTYAYCKMSVSSNSNFILAPTHQMTMKWLREVHNIHIESFCPVVDTTDEPIKYNVVISDLRNHCLAFNTPLENKEFDSYEQACETAIKYCLEYLI